MDEAIAQKKKSGSAISTTGWKKQHESKNYTLSPYEMVYMNERYYLICIPDQAPNTRLYRIDRMKDIQIWALQYLPYVEVVESACWAVMILTKW